MVTRIATFSIGNLINLLNKISPINTHSIGGTYFLDKINDLLFTSFFFHYKEKLHRNKSLVHKFVINSAQIHYKQRAISYVNMLVYDSQTYFFLSRASQTKLQKRRLSVQFKLISLSLTLFKHVNLLILLSKYISIIGAFPS